MKILRMEASNVKRLTAVEISPEGNAIVIGGKNEAGKSSTLDAIEMALAGGKSHPPRPVHGGRKKATIRLDLGEGEELKLVVKKTITAKGGGTLTVETADGEVQKSPQAILDALVGAISFDPSEFSRMKENEQIEKLKEIVPDLDFKDMDAKRAQLYSVRRDKNRDAKEATAAAQSIEFYPDAPDEAVDVAALSKELERRLRQNADNERARQAVNEAATEIEEEEEALAELAEQVAAIEAEIRRLQQEMAETHEKIAKDEEAIQNKRIDLAKCENEAAELVDADVEDVRRQINGARDINEQVTANAQRKVAVEKARQLTDEAEALDGQIEELDAQKREAIEAAQFPIEGLAFDEDGVTFNGVPFQQASQSERWRASIAIGIAANPKLRVMLIREGALLDDEHLKMVAEMAEAADMQLWIEDVGDKRSSVVIEDGTVREE